MTNPLKTNIFAKNAVLFKEMSINIKRPKLLILMMIFNGIILMIAGGFLLSLAGLGLSGNPINYRNLVNMLITLIATEAGILFMVMPALTGNTIAGERERQTLDVLLTTRMTPMEIVIGKYLSIIMMGSLLVLSTFPFLAIVFIYGGINFLQLLGLVFVLIFEIGYVAVFGVLFSSLTKRTAPSVILSYVVLGFLLVGTILLYAIIYAIVESMNYSRPYYSYQNSGGVHADWLIFLLYLNPGVTIFDCIGKFIGVEVSDSSFKGMSTVVDMSYIRGDNFFIVFWTPISMAIQGAITFGLLRWAGYALSPVKNTKKRERDFERRNMKNIGVQPEFEQLGGKMPVPPAAPQQPMQPGQPGAVPMQGQRPMQPGQPVMRQPGPAVQAQPNQPTVPQAAPPIQAAAPQAAQPIQAAAPQAAQPVQAAQPIQPAAPVQQSHPQQ